MRRTLATATPVWAAVIAGLAILLLVGRPAVWLPSIPVIGAGAMLLTFVIQVSLQSKDGLVHRMLVSVSGIVLLLAAASIVILLVL